MNARIYEIMYPVLYLPLLHGSYSAISTRYYIDSFSNYSSLYGSFTSIALFMLWLYVCVSLLFVGALINRFHIDGYSLFSPKSKNKIKNQFETLKESILPENNDK